MWVSFVILGDKSNNKSKLKMVSSENSENTSNSTKQLKQLSIPMDLMRDRTKGKLFMKYLSDNPFNRKADIPIKTSYFDESVSEEEMH